MGKFKLIGPFKQLLTMDQLPGKGALSDNQLEIITDAGILVNGSVIESVGSYRELKSLAATTEPIDIPCCAIPGMVDVHTHICWAGSRAADYALRLAGNSYLEIAAQGGGIWSTVTHTRKAGQDDLARLTAERANKLLQQGSTTVEVKSGYGLDVESELTMLRAIRQASGKTHADLVPTCLAAHIKPRDFTGTGMEYLGIIIEKLLPVVKAEGLSNRVDIYVDQGAFHIEEARFYLAAAKALGFQVTVHADQFSSGGLQLAVEMGAGSAEHLEATTDKDLRLLAQSSVIPVALPGASMGLGTDFAPARKILDAGGSLVIASDWNPGSAPMGNLLMQAAILGVYEKLTLAETLAAITCRAAPALQLTDRGILRPGMLADFITFPCTDFREIVYNQGGMVPFSVWKGGVQKLSK